MSIDLTDRGQLINLLKKYGLWAKKRLGQHFLISREALDKIIASAKLESDDVVVEIGPGHGVLTRELLPRTKKVFAIEIDDSILPVLRDTTHFYRDRLEICHQHILDYEPPTVPYKLVANIPYHLTSPILRKFLVETERRPLDMTLLVQKEVAERICNKHRKSIISLIVEVFGDAEIISIVPAAAFFPPPKVDSAILHIHVASLPRIAIAPQIFFHTVKMGFSQPRKKLKNNISVDMLTECGINGDLRAENLSVADWEKLANSLQAKVQS